MELLESSFNLLAPKGEELVSRFYERLFETALHVRELFPDDMKGQETALLGALGMTVKACRSPDTLVPVLEGLVRRHVGCRHA